MGYMASHSRMPIALGVLFFQAFDLTGNARYQAIHTNIPYHEAIYMGLMLSKQTLAMVAEQCSVANVKAAPPAAGPCNAAVHNLLSPDCQCKACSTAVYIRQYHGVKKSHSTSDADALEAGRPQQCN